MSDQDLRIGVIGVGQRAALARLVATPGFGARVAGCADPRPGARAHAAELFGPEVPVFDDHRELLGQNLDAVMVFTPDDGHRTPVLAALTAGVAVFVEKPLAISTDDCDEILQTARTSGSRLYVGHNLRHLPLLRRMKELIDEGVIGQVKSIWCRHFVGHGGDYYFRDWHADRSHTLGLLLQKGAHDLDVIHWLAGAPSQQVVAMGELQVYGNEDRRRSTPEPPGAVMADWFDARQWPPTELDRLNPVVDVEDLSMMLSRLTNGVLASYQQCHYTPDYWRNYTVIGDSGRMENFGDTVGDPSGTIKVWNQHRSGYREDADLSITIRADEGSHGGADAAIVSEFLRFVRAGGATDTSPVAARDAVAAGVAATRSLRSGSVPVDITALPTDLVDYFARGQTR